MENLNLFLVNILQGLDKVHHLDLEGGHFGQLLFLEWVGESDPHQGFQEVNIA